MEAAVRASGRAPERRRGQIQEMIEELDNFPLRVEVDVLVRENQALQSQIKSLEQNLEQAIAALQETIILFDLMFQDAQNIRNKAERKFLGFWGIFRRSKMYSRGSQVSEVTCRYI
jgi:hypothetical protein